MCFHIIYRVTKFKNIFLDCGFIALPDLKYLMKRNSYNETYTSRKQSNESIKLNKMRQLFLFERSEAENLFAFKQRLNTPVE